MTRFFKVWSFVFFIAHFSSVELPHKSLARFDHISTILSNGSEEGTMPLFPSKRKRTIQHATHFRALFRGGKKNLSWATLFHFLGGVLTLQVWGKAEMVGVLIVSL